MIPSRTRLAIAAIGGLLLALTWFSPPTVAGDDDVMTLEDVVRLIHVPSVVPGRLLHVVMDGEEDRALAWVGPPR